MFKVPMRQPIICMLGHVDTGKTSLLDKIRGTAVQLREAGGLTQQIGASFFPFDTLVAITQQLVKNFKVNITVPGLLVVDTPGHEAFANLRTRGGSVSDIAILVVDVMHGFENQTYESLNILKSRKVPFIIAANKIDRIDGWKSTENMPFLESYKAQNKWVREDLDNRLYIMMGTLSREGLASERFDRVKDFTKNVAIVPVSAKTGEGIGELLAVLIGLTQQFLEQKLQVTDGPALGTVLEVREETGLGITLNAIIYDGTLKAEDTIVIGGKEGPIVTKIRAILVPQPLDEMRDPRKQFNNITEVHAAAGIKIAAPDIDDAIPGAPLIAVGGDMTLEKALDDVASDMERLKVQTDQSGIIVKTDTLGSLEAIVESLRAKQVPIRLADIGDVSRRDVIEALSVKHDDPLFGAILAFNVKVLPDAEREAYDQKIPIFWNDIIYNLMDEYIRWADEEREAKARKEYDVLVKPGKLQIMEGYIFRRAKPAIFGAKVLSGTITPRVHMINHEGDRLGRISQIQDGGDAIGKAEEGAEVAVAMPQPIVGRHIKERDILYVDVPEQHAKQLRAKFGGRLTESEAEALKELVELKHKKDMFWAA
ncbi:MAG: translation initiation factor IF-2 [Candidatus Bathyarchaeota archaeon]|nr:translation initiation factor IF-2 [Candidatus Bathyarchaeota archaeon]